ncbi:hypothetical protein ACOSQ4_022393 [Xanthoceras sorbifolium]
MENIFQRQGNDITLESTTTKLKQSNYCRKAKEHIQPIQINSKAEITCRTHITKALASQNSYWSDHQVKNEHNQTEKAEMQLNIIMIRSFHYKGVRDRVMY